MVDGKADGRTDKKHKDMPQPTIFWSKIDPPKIILKIKSIFFLLLEKLEINGYKRSESWSETSDLMLKYCFKYICSPSDWSQNAPRVSCYSKEDRYVVSNEISGWLLVLRFKVVRLDLVKNWSCVQKDRIVRQYTLQ